MTTHRRSASPGNTGALTAGLVLAWALLAGAPSPGLAQSADGRTGTIVGMVYDSTTAAPLSGASIAVMGTAATARSGEDGQFRLDDVPVGERSLTFFHPRLGELGVGGGNQSVVVREGGIAEVLLSVPSRTTLLSAWCSAEPGSGNTSIAGTVTDALTGVPLPGAHVGALGDRSGVLQRRRLVAEVSTDNAGEFRLCNLDASEDLTVEVLFGANKGEPIGVVGSGPKIMDISISISEPVTITGTVLDYATRGPLPGARVQLAGTDFSVQTDTAGRFGFSGVPPGKQIIQTDQLGYASRTDSLTVFSNEALGLEIVLSTEAIVLEPIVVTGRARDGDILTTPGTRFSGLTEAQVDSIAPRVFDFATLARAARMPGLSVTETLMADGFGGQQMGVCIEMVRSRSTGGANTCNMVEVRINDAPVPEPHFFLLQMNPQDIRRLQFITPIEAGLLYGSRGVNGVLLLYTR